MESKLTAAIDSVDFSGIEERIISDIYSCQTTGEIVTILDRTLKKDRNSLNIQQIRDSLLRASAKAHTFDDLRILYLFSFFSVYPKIWPDFKWVDSLMESAVNYCKNEQQLLVLYKDATLMGRSAITEKTKSKMKKTAHRAV
jgi:hypothetical protein